MRPFSFVQIYTDRGVMYKNGQNLRHFAGVFSISRLHCSSKKLSDNTKGHFILLPELSFFFLKKKMFPWV